MNVYDILTHTDSIKLGDFEIFGDIKLPLFFEYGNLISKPRYFDFITDLLAEEVRNIGPDKIVGAFTSGYPLTAAVSLKTNISQALVRRKRKIYGTQKQIEGMIENGDSVIIIDDFLTNMENNLEFIEAIEEQGGRVTHLLVILDFDIGAKEELAQRGIDVVSLITPKELISKMCKRNALSKEEKEEILKKIKSIKKKNLSGKNIDVNTV